MVWSLVKIVIFIALVAAATFGAGWVIEAGGEVRVSLGATEFSLTPLAGAVVLVLLLIAGWIAFRLAGLLVATLRFINGDETAISRYFDRNRERRGFEALADALMALASGEGRQAMSRASKAQKLLQKPELTNLLIAQAAEMSGDTARAEAAYKKLITDQSTRFVGVRGIMKQKLAAGDSDTARKLAEKALSLKPAHEETQDVLLTLQTKAQDWAGARSTLGAKLKTGTLPRDVYRRRDAVLALSEAKGVTDEDASIDARERAIEANRLSPDLIPAAVMAAQGYLDRGKPRNAARLLRKAWEVHPHPDLAAAFARIAPDETPAQRIKRFSALTKLHPHNPETRLLLAELNIVAEDFPEARRALGDLVEQGGDARAFTLMAAIERGEGSPDTVVQGWLARALTAPRGPQWVCDHCNHIHGDWTPVCENCGGFDTLSWTAPKTQERTSATGVHMLPLIVGKIEDRSDVPYGSPDEPASTENDDAAPPADGAGDTGEPEVIGETAQEPAQGAGRR